MDLVNDGTAWQLMLIPQASLCGKMKGKVAQYHALKPKTEGEALYNNLKDTLEQASTHNHPEWKLIYYYRN